MAWWFSLAESSHPCNIQRISFFLSMSTLNDSSICLQKWYISVLIEKMTYCRIDIEKRKVVLYILLRIIIFGMNTDLGFCPLILWICQFANSNLYYKKMTAVNKTSMQTILIFIANKIIWQMLEFILYKAVKLQFIFPYTSSHATP